MAIILLSACSSVTDAPPVSSQIVEQSTQAANTPPTNIRANGILLPIQQMELSFGTGGFIKAVEVGIGESVSAGQVLVRLDSTEAGYTLQQTEAELAAALANYDLVVAGTPAERQVAISAASLDLLAAQQTLAAIHVDADLEAAQALQAVVEAQIAVNDAQRYLDSLSSAVNQSFIDAAYANMILAGSSLDKAKEAYKPWRNKSETNITRAALLSALAEAQQAYDATVRRYNGMLGSASEIHFSQAEADFALAQARLSNAQGMYEILSEGPDPAKIALAEAEAANAQARLTLAEAGGPSAEQIALALAQVDAASGNLDLVRSQIDQMAISAPFDGVISTVQAQQGEWAAAGELMVEVLDTSRWRIETKNVGELQIGQIQIGQEVTVSINAFNNEALSGRVVSISPVAIVQQGDTTYTLSIELEPTDLNLWPGMTAQVEINIAEE